jgi:acetyl esterase
MKRPLPEIDALLSAMPDGPLDLTRPVADLRSICDAGLIAMKQFVRRPVSDVTVTDIVIPGPAGDIAARVYEPDTSRVRGLHLHLHGGGWWMGSLDTSDPMVRELAAATGLVVVSVGYRLAPEHPWPAGVEDAYAALCYAAARAEHMTEGSRRVSVGGESAGGNLTAVVSLMARDRGGPAIAGCWLDVPAVDLTMPDDPSLRDYGTGYGLDIDPSHHVANWYVDEQHRRHPYVSPAFADLTGLPPTLVTTAELDPLRDQGERFSRQLLDAGVPTTLIRADGQVHASTWLTALTTSAADWHDQVSQWLVGVHAAASEPVVASA